MQAMTFITYYNCIKGGANDDQLLLVDFNLFVFFGYWGVLFNFSFKKPEF